MTVYSANIFDLAQKVTNGKKKANIPTETTKADTIIPKSVSPKVQKRSKLKKVVEPEVEVPPPSKKPRTEKQLASDQKRREAAEKKRQETHNEKLRALYASNVEPKKKAPKPKNESKIIKPKLVEPTIIEPQECPAWFKQFVTTNLNKENKELPTALPKEDVRDMAKAVAQEKWKDDGFRSAVMEEKKSHQQRMYEMMFN